ESRHDVVPAPRRADHAHLELGGGGSDELPPAPRVVSHLSMNRKGATGPSPLNARRHRLDGQERSTMRWVPEGRSLAPAPFSTVMVAGSPSLTYRSCGFLSK